MLVAMVMELVQVIVMVMVRLMVRATCVDDGGDYAGCDAVGCNGHCKLECGLISVIIFSFFSLTNTLYYWDKYTLIPGEINLMQ